MEFTINITTVLIIGLLFSCIFNVVLIFLLNRALIRVEKYEQYVLRYTSIFQKIQLTIEQGEMKLKELDTIGAFESDDEIGFFFKQVKELQKILTEVTSLEDVNQQEEK